MEGTDAQKQSGKILALNQKLCGKILTKMEIPSAGLRRT